MRKMRKGLALVVVLLPLLAQSRLLAPGPRTSPRDTDSIEYSQGQRESTSPRSIQQLQPQLKALLALMQSAPRRSLATVIAARLLAHHVRTYVEKRAALRALRAATTKTSVAIVTTAALPWKTGTAVNALLRAAYLADAGHRVTLCLPWIHPVDQVAVFPGGKTFGTPAEQEQHMLEWLSQRDGQQSSFTIVWYPARYDHTRGSILPLGDTTKWLRDAPSDLCVLEEPEHLNWYHAGRNWRRCFKVCVPAT